MAYFDHELCMVEITGQLSDGEDFEPNAAQPQDSTSPQREYGPSNFHGPHGSAGSLPTTCRLWAAVGGDSRMAGD